MLLSLNDFEISDYSEIWSTFSTIIKFLLFGKGEQDFEDSFREIGIGLYYEIESELMLSSNSTFGLSI